ncbi:aspartyl protease family protein [Ferrimonas gelatinilytica]|uniref:Peptidase A2 domain-containing protein n=1 Tax=Ferrimonas gelatinilytica TaxID=1255257 RepID=A0ABP9RTS8_9GAMM
MKVWILSLGLLLLTAQTSAAVTPWLDFTLKNGHIYVPMTVNGIEVEAILDSGAEINLISEAVAEQSGVQLNVSNMTISGVYGKTRAKAASGVPITLFGFDTKMGFYSVDSSVPVLIGKPFFDEFIVQFDYPNQRMRLLTRDAVEGDWDNLSIRQERNSTLPAVQVRLDNREDVWLTLDTGASSGLLLDRLFALEHELVTEEKELQHLSGVNESAVAEAFSMPLVTFGPYQLEQVETVIPGEGEATNLRKLNPVLTGTRIQKGVKTKGLLGYDVLKHFLLTLDTREYKAHVIAQ